MVRVPPGRRRRGRSSCTGKEDSSVTAGDAAASSLTSWVERVVAVTGWEADQACEVDWTSVEERLGTALPGDYKQLVERFGYGAFDGCLDLLPPDGPRGSLDLVEFNEWWARWAVVNGDSSWEPYRLYPSPGGPLQWASTEQKTSFYWLTEGPDPDRWPILVTDVGPADWDRFDC